jgi:hypothetical protein
LSVVSGCCESKKCVPGDGLAPGDPSTATAVIGGNSNYNGSLPMGARKVEVWFDKSALGGGDQWDPQIRHKILNCALFVPIISANSEHRLEGYFRREWKIAADRIRRMADGVPFLVPVVVDATADASAHVPEIFR